MNEATLARFYAKVVAGPEHCHLWVGGRTRSGHGQISIQGRHVYVHRAVYEHYVGPIPEGLQIDHLCRTRNCVNPTHLEPVTARENVVRGDGPEILANRQRSKTHCPKGHPLSGDNLYVHKSRTERQCLTCKRANNRNSYHRTKEAK